jgi:hypothetical protein
LAQKVIEIEELPQPVANQHRFVVAGYEPGNVLFQQHLMLIYHLEDELVSIV